ncbi:hypothetical protein ACFL1D_00070 [Candidatus Omnitrophota bacterium]
MTFKKINKSIHGQSIFEYCILTISVVAIVLFFTKSKFFTNPNPGPGERPGIKEICNDAFDQAVDDMLR